MEDVGGAGHSRNVDRSVSFSAWKIAQHQKSKTLIGLKQILQLAQIDLGGNGPGQASETTKEYVRQLEIQVAKCSVELDELRDLEARGQILPSSLKDRVVLFVYGWALNGR